MPNREDISLADRKYINVVMAHDEKKEGYTYAVRKENYNQIVINRPSDYYLSVLRFQIPTADIPLLIPEIEGFPTNTNVNKTVYSVTLEWEDPMGNIKTSGETFVIFESVVKSSTPRPINADNPDPMIDPSDYYFIYTPNQFIEMVNTTFITAFNALNAATGGVLTSVPPYFTYDPTTLLITLNADVGYLNTTIRPIKIYVNYKLYTFFDNIDYLFYSYTGAKGVQFMIKNTYNNLFSGIYRMTQQFNSLATWDVFKSIQILSSFIPVENEIVPSPRDPSNYNTFSVVKDFVPFYETGTDFRQFINYRYSGSYELINLNSNYPITTIDISVYWVDRYGNRYQVSIPYNQVLSIKLCFIKKSTFTG